MYSRNTFSVDFDQPYENVEIATLSTLAAPGTLQSYYVTGRGTRILIEESTSSSVAVVPASLRDEDDVHLVAYRSEDPSWGTSGRHLSYRRDPTTASTRIPAERTAPVVWAATGRTLLLSPMDLGDAQFAAVFAATAGAAFEVVTTPAYLDGEDALTVEPPESFDPAWRFGEPGQESYGFGAAFVESNLSVRELLDEELLRSFPRTPRERDGRDLTYLFVEGDRRFDAAP